MLFKQADLGSFQHFYYEDLPYYYPFSFFERIYDFCVVWPFKNA